MIDYSIFIDAIKLLFQRVSMFVVFQIHSIWFEMNVIAHYYIDSIVKLLYLLKLYSIKYCFTGTGTDIYLPNNVYLIYLSVNQSIVFDSGSDNNSDDSKQSMNIWW